MNKIIRFRSNRIHLWAIVIVVAGMTSHCTPGDRDVYNRIRSYADQIKVIDTHEHQRWLEPGENQSFNFYHLMGYLGGDIGNAGAIGLNSKRDTLSLDEMWDTYGEFINYTRNTSFYSSLVKGFQKLYGFDDLYFTKENIPALSARIENNYNDYESWFEEAFHTAGFELMLVMLADKDDFFSYSFPSELDERYFALVFVINRFMDLVNIRPENGIYNLRRLSYEMLGLENFRVDDLDDYLVLCDQMLKRNIGGKAVAVKNTLAYVRTLEYEDIPYETAFVLFDKRPELRTPEEKKKVEDFMFHWTIQKCIEYDLPIQIHTGLGYGDSGNPVKLTNLFGKYPQARFVLLHGGFPWTGECAMVGKQFPNVYLDLVWLPQLSRQEAVSALDVMLDCVPYNKFLWGGDCLYIEESTGALELGKDVVAEVLTKRIKRGLLTENVAIDIIRKIFRENAIDVFKLEERLGRKF